MTALIGKTFKLFITNALIIYPCSSSCLYGGTCVDGVNTFTCECAVGFRGSNCQSRENPCDSSPCKNRGQCRNKDNNFQCVCPYGHTGPRCEILIDWCLEKKPCQNNGECHQNGTEYICKCKPGWTGDECDMQSISCQEAAGNSFLFVDLIRISQMI